MKRDLCTSRHRFRAPWSGALRWITGLGCTVLLGTAIALWVVPSREAALARGVGSVAILLLLAGTALFTVRGYRLEGRHLLVDRLFWSTRVPLDGLRSTEIAGDAMRRSIRLCGNGGMFAFTGWFRNRRLGTYRCFATDPSRAVVLHFADRRVVVTPEDPRRFAETVEAGPA